MKNISLQLRLILSFLFIAGTVWLVSAILAWVEGKEEIDEFFDTYQLVLARQLATVDWKDITPNTQKRVNKVIDILDNDGEEDDEALGLAVFDANGKMIFHDNNNGRQFKYDASASGFMNQTLGKKQKLWRIVWIKSIDGLYTVAIGQELNYRNEIALELIEETFLPWACGLIILLTASIWLVHREFRPLKKITNTLKQRESDNLSPLDDKNSPQEIKPLIVAINELFARIIAMLQKERSFIADAAHELRSPLTALNVQLDVVELAVDDPDTQQKALRNLREGLTRSSHLVEQMLALSKLDSQIILQEQENLNWQNILSVCVAEQQENASQKKISILQNIRSNFSIVSGQSFLWSLLFRNLLDNAIKYSQSGAQIKIDIETNKIKISNNKTNIDNKYLSRLGERFFRPAGQKNNGSGLGLSIVEKVAMLHRCNVRYLHNRDVFTVVIEVQEPI